MSGSEFRGFRRIRPLPWHRHLSFSVLAHLVVFGLAVWLFRPNDTRMTFILLEPPQPPAEVTLPPVGGTRVGPRRPAPVVRAEPRVIGVPDSSAGGGVETGGGGGRFRMLMPQLGDGRLWVRPRVEISSDNMTVLNIPVDSAVRVRIQQMVDSFNLAWAREPRGGRPDWTREIAGAKWGLDSQFVYIAGIKVPAMLLALLPLPQGNIEEAERAAMLNAQRQEIQFDAARQGARQDQRRYADEMRRRKQEEREAERRRRERPPAEQPIP